MQPSDSLASFSRGFGSPRRRPTSWASAFLPIVSATGACACRRASFGDESPALQKKTGTSRGEARASRVTGLPSSCVPWCNTPPDTTPPRPYFTSRRSTERSPSPSRKTERSASGNDIVFEATYPRPTRSRTYASPISLPRPSPGSLPARAGSPLAGRVSHPLDSRRNFMESSHPPIPIDQQSLVALISYAPPKNPTKPGQNLTWGQGLRGSGAPGAQSLRDTPALDGDGVDAPRGQRVRGLGATRPPHPPRDAALRPAGGRATGKCPAAPARERKTPAGSLRLRLASSAILLRRLEKPRTLRRRRASRSRGRVPPMRAEGE